MKLLIEALKDAAAAGEEVDITVENGALTVHMGLQYFFSRSLSAHSSTLNNIEIEMARFIWRTIERKYESRQHDTSIPDYFK